MAKIPYLFRRKNIYYFRLSAPPELREIVKVREISQSLRTQNSDEAAHKALKLAAHFKTLLHDLKTGKRTELNRDESLTLFTKHENPVVEPSQAAPASTPTLTTHNRQSHKRRRCPLSLVIF